MQPRNRPRGALPLVFAILLLDVVGISLLYPIAPYLVLRYSADALMVTLFTVIYAAAQFMAAPVLGRLGDRFGRRPVLLLSLLGSAIGYLVLGIGGALWIVLLSRLIDGITAGNQSVATAYIADVSTDDTRARDFALVGLAWGSGLVVGPAAGAALGQWHLEAPAFAAAGLALLALVLGLVWLPESLPPAQRVTRQVRLGDFNPFGAIWSVWNRPGLDTVLLALCLFNGAFQGIASIESLFLVERFAAQPWHIGAVLVCTGATIVLVQRLVGPLVARWGAQRVATSSLLLLGLGALAMCLVPVLWLVIPINIVRTIASGLVFPTTAVLLTARVAHHDHGALLGVNTALASCMTMVGPLWAGAVYERVMPQAPYWMGAAIFALAAYVLLRVPTREALATHNQPGVEQPPAPQATPRP